MKLWAVILLVALVEGVLMASPPRKDSMNLLSLLRERKNVPSECTLCVDLLTDFEMKFGGNGTYEDLEHFINNTVCPLLPTSKLRDHCHEEAPVVASNAEELGIWVIDGLSPFHLCTMLGACNVCCCRLPVRPEQHHISVTGDPTEMVVSWVEGENITDVSGAWGLEGQVPHVIYGTSANNLNMEAPATVTTYEKAGWLGYIYHAKITGLTPSTTYYYRAGAPINGSGYVMGYSFHTFQFTTPPKTSPDTPSKWIVYGDMGVCDVSDLNVFHIETRAQNKQIDGVLHAGDISYANGYQATWDNFFNKIELVAGYVPYMTAVGNHEIPYNFTSFKHRMRMPGEESGSNTNMYFSFDYGSAHIIAYNFEEDLGLSPDTRKGKQQYEWLENDLIKATQNRANVPWIVL